ncbi:MAG: efflux RND transporter periplasmic adaptor subunit [Planctomycetota bacterium]|nr:efflux RND transporter periplasmic adaptor subunit [Planctomycetota bacterium]
MKYAILFILVLAAGGGGYWMLAHRETKAASDQPQVPTAKAERQAISLVVATTGRVVAHQDVDIKCKASGQVVKLPFDISDTVKKGDLLMELDPVDEQRQVTLAEADLAASKARLEKAKQTLTLAEITLKTDRMRAEADVMSAEAQVKYAHTRFDRMKELAEQRYGSQEDADQSQAQMISADANLATAKVRMEELKAEEQSLELKRQDVKLAETDMQSDEIKLADMRQRLADTSVLAPIDGVVAVRNVEIGTIISSGISNVGGGTTVATISDLSRMFALASVDESDIGKVAVDQAANVTADAFPNRRFTGKVVRVATRGVSASNIVTFEVKIEITSPNKRMLKPEMTTNIEIVAAEKEDAIVVPADAVGRQKGKRVVTVVKPDGATEERAVEAGINDGTNIEIASGLAEGENVQLRRGAADSKWSGGGGSGAAKKYGPGGFSFGGGKR